MMNKINKIFMMTALVGTIGFNGSITSTAYADMLDNGNAAFLKQDYKMAVKHFTEAFRKGNTEAGYYLARMFELGLGVPADKAAAIKFYQATANGGYLPSINRVALMYYNGESGIKQDYKEAFNLFNKAVEKGDANATFNLGKMFFEGKGTVKDPIRALELYKTAADKDHILALNTLGQLYKYGSKNQVDLKKAETYFQRSAELGNSVGLFEMGEFAFRIEDEADNNENTEEEKSLRANFIKAHMYFNLASATGHPKATQALQELTAIMSNEEVEKAQDAARNYKVVSESKNDDQ